MEEQKSNVDEMRNTPTEKKINEDYDNGYEEDYNKEKPPERFQCCQII